MKDTSTPRFRVLGLEQGRGLFEQSSCAVFAKVVKNAMVLKLQAKYLTGF
jgi:hypothetical protein